MERKKVITIIIIISILGYISSLLILYFNIIISETLPSSESIIIENENQLLEYVSSGNGSALNPYIIENLELINT